MTSVTTEFTCLFTVPGCEPMQGHVAMSWEHSSPFQVTLDFTNVDDSHSIWIVSRDCFADCLLNPPGAKFGGHDFVLDRGLASIGIELNGDGGTASVSFPLQPVVAFMTQTLLRVPRGEAEAEQIAVEMDAFLADVLDNG